MLPLRRILVGVDFSPASERACALAAAVAARSGAELLLVHAVDSALAEAALAQGRDLRGDASHMLAALAPPDVPAHVHVVEGPACRVLADRATREGADLIVVGSRGLGDDDPPGLGATAEGLLRSCTRPVLIVPAGWTPPVGADGRIVLGPIVAGLDLDCPALDASLAACRLAAALGTTATLIHAVPPPQAPPSWRAHADHAAGVIRERNAHDLERVIAALRSQVRADVPSQVVHGPVARVLTDALRREPGSILVLGRGSRVHDYGPPGSIVSRVVMAAQGPVLVHVSA